MECPCVAGFYCDESSRCRICPKNSSSPHHADKILGCSCKSGYSYSSQRGVPCLPNKEGTHHDRTRAHHDVVDSDVWTLRSYSSSSSSIPSGFPFPRICYSDSDCKYDGCGIHGSCDSSWACWLSQGRPVCTSAETGKYSCALCAAPGEVTCVAPCSWNTARAQCICTRCPPGRSPAQGSEASDCMLLRNREPAVGALCNQTNLSSVTLLDGTSCVMCKPDNYSPDGLACSPCLAASSSTSFGSEGWL
jgi:hypothetical protein